MTCRSPSPGRISDSAFLMVCCAKSIDNAKILWASKSMPMNCPPPGFSANIVGGRPDNDLLFSSSIKYPALINCPT